MVSEIRQSRPHIAHDLLRFFDDFAGKGDIVCIPI